jgi:hypothetical protein
MATTRSSRVSRARYTSPMPPVPRGDTISYGPSLEPEAKGTVAQNYKPPSIIRMAGKDFYLAVSGIAVTGEPEGFVAGTSETGAAAGCSAAASHWRMAGIALRVTSSPILMSSGVR